MRRVDHTVTTPGGRLFVREWPPARAAPAPPLVLIHDSLGCVELWRDFPQLVCAQTGRRVIAYDRLGFGRSDARSGPLSNAFVRAEAESSMPRILEHLGMSRFIAFGHSVGGGMAVHCATALAAACAGVITESAQMFAEDRTLREIAAAKLTYRDPAQLAKLRRYHGDKAQWVLDAWTDTWLSPEFASWTLRAELPRIRCPMLAIHGEDDEFGSLAHPEMIRASSGGRTQICILPGFGHVPHREQPGKIAAIVAGFVARIVE